MKHYFLKSAGSIAAGFVLVVILSVATDLALQNANVMRQPFHLNPAWFIGLVVVYRNLFSTAGAYVTATLAPGKPMRLALIGGMIGFIVSVTGAIVTWNTPPRWYAVSLVATALPCAWLGGKLYLIKRISNEKTNRTDNGNFSTRSRG